MISSAQTKLANRLAQHNHELNHLPQEKIQPAAHLDPGPEGYNIYGKAGHSLAMTSVPLDNNETLNRLTDQRCSESEISLSKARSLLGRYCAGQVIQRPSSDDSANEKLDCPSAPVTHLSGVVSAYDEAITKLLKSERRELAAQAMSELGDVMWDSSHGKAATHWWREALSTITRIQDPLSGSWRKVLRSSSTLAELGVWGCLLAAINATKLARLGSLL